MTLSNTVSVVQQRRQHVLNSWNDFKSTVKQRKEKLEASRRLQQFLRNADELEAWMNEKLAVATDCEYEDGSNLQSKMKKHSAFEAETLANQDAVGHLQHDGQELIDEKHFAADLIAAKLEAVAAQWQYLTDKTNAKTQQLLEGQSLVLFRHEADEVYAWIHERMTIASSEDIGRDLEHCEILQKKFEEFCNDLNANEARVEAINERALSLISDGHPEGDTIRQRQQDVNDAWAALKESAVIRGSLLSDAREIHR